ncbi:hypothetical protein TSUD_82670 [Trifolium subterraneum]|uniref:Uncharacterized protein n=1 Tax=Trifolium subterraneum TaxID=3900 RepID=A0A2Z6M3K4_TRISU|nr:hypothetical protein TSUD_82670 [Trifolium subterraneum]
MNADCLWNWLENFGSATDVSCLSSVSPDSLMIKDVLDHYIQLLNLSSPIKMENKNVVEELACFLDEMKQLRAAMSMSDLVIEKNTLVLLSKKILSRRSKVTDILYQLNLACQKSNTNAESDPSHARVEVGNDDPHKQNILKESKDGMSNNSQGAVNSGHGKAKGKNKSKKNKGKKAKK